MYKSVYPYCLSALPIFILVFLVLKFSVNIPYMDQWDSVPLLEKSYLSNVTLTDLWTQHNEHRPLFPRIIMIALAHFTNWNIRYESVVNIILAIGTFAILSLSFSKYKWYLPIFSLFVFSLVQWENWLWGWQIQIFVNILAATLGLFLLTRANLSIKIIFLSLIFGSIAAYSFANGLIFFLIGFLVLFFSSNKKKNFILLIWCLWTSGLYFSYFAGFKYPQDSPDILSVLKDPFGFIIYILIYSGTPLSINSPFAAIYVGIIGLSMFFYSIFRFKTQNQLALSNNKFFTSVGLYAIGSALITALARVGFGIEQAATSRYTTIAQLLWLANIVFLYQIIKNKKILISVLTIIIVLSVSSSVSELWIFPKRYDLLKKAQKALISQPNHPIIRILHPQTHVVSKMLPVLEKYKLTFFY